MGSFFTIQYIIDRRSMLLHHSQKMIALSKLKKRTKEQLYIRAGHLNGYDFEQYNLTEALIIQKSIKLSQLT